MQRSDAPAEGTAIGSYRVVRAIGEDDMDAVYVVEHNTLPKRFALKLLRPELSASPEYRNRFIREGQVSALVKHPNVVEVTDAGVHDGADYIVMELLEGESLQARLARAQEKGERLQFCEVLEIMFLVIVGMKTVHDQGLVHRDLKPGNIFLSREGNARVVVPKVLDFGIARYRDQRGPSTNTGAVMGTPGYMAPEQYGHAGRADERADQYALGAVLYECLTGAPPALAHVMVGTYDRLAKLRPDLPPEVDQVVSRMLMVEPAARYAALVDAVRVLAPLADRRTGDDVLGEFGVSREVAAPAAAAVASAPAPRRRPWALWGILAAAALAAVVWGALGARKPVEATAPAVAAPRATEPATPAAAPRAAAPPTAAASKFLPVSAPRVPDAPPAVLPAAVFRPRNDQPAHVRKKAEPRQRERPGLAGKTDDYDSLIQTGP